jgi:hypothetical protein
MSLPSHNKAVPKFHLNITKKYEEFQLNARNDQAMERKKDVKKSRRLLLGNVQPRRPSGDLFSSRKKVS